MSKSNHTGLYWWGLNPVTSVLLRDTQVRRLREVFLMEEEAGGVQSLAKEHLEPPEARRGKDSVSHRTFGRSMFLLTPCCQTSALQVAGN